jgi:predicted porin
MKKSLIALAALAAVSAASAQSTVTISGSYGAAQQSFERTALVQKGIAVTDSSIRLTAVEDLGGGLRATFFSQFTAGSERGKESSAGVTKEDSSISLAGGFGTIALTNTRTSDTGINGMVFASWLPRTQWYDTVSARAATDIISYTSPELIKGLRVGISSSEIAIVTASGLLTDGDGIFTFGSLTGSTGSAGLTTLNTNYKVTTLSANYMNGPLTVMAAQKQTNYNSTLVAAGAKKGNSELAAIYDFGVAKVGFAYDSKTTTTGDALTGYSFNVPFGAMDIGFNTAKRGDTKFVEYGVNYNLSKRTSVRAQAGKMSGTTSNGGTSTIGDQYRVGVLHTF